MTPREALAQIEAPCEHAEAHNRSDADTWEVITSERLRALLAEVDPA